MLCSQAYVASFVGIFLLVIIRCLPARVPFLVFVALLATLTVRCGWRTTGDILERGKEFVQLAFEIGQVCLQGGGRLLASITVKSVWNGQGRARSCHGQTVMRANIGQTHG